MCILRDLLYGIVGGEGVRLLTTNKGMQTRVGRGRGGGGGMHPVGFGWRGGYGMVPSPGFRDKIGKSWWGYGIVTWG